LFFSCSFQCNFNNYFHLQLQILKSLRIIIAILAIRTSEVPETFPSILHPYDLLTLILGLGNARLTLNAILVASLVAEAPLQVFLHGPVTHIFAEIRVCRPRLYHVSVSQAYSKMTSHLPSYTHARSYRGLDPTKGSQDENRRPRQILRDQPINND